MTHKGQTQADIDATAKKTALEAEEKDLMAYLEASRYHVDIAIETGSEVFADIAEARAKARKRIGEIHQELKG